MKSSRPLTESAVTNVQSRLARVLLTLFAMVALQVQPARAATITTDREDYAPFTFVGITGAGFQPGETVNNQVVQVIGPIAPYAYPTWDVTADETGGFSTTWYVFTDELIGTTLELTATGQSSQLTATTTFTDAAPPCAPPPTGAPLTGTPTGGFAMDGDLQANGTTGDWVPGSGSGGSVLNAAGVPINSTTTFHLIDAYGVAENNFAGGDKVDDNPNTWNWVINPTTAKDDINNALIHISTASDGHRWLVLSADRASNKGDSYIDFEFLQHSLSLTGVGGTNGGFVSTGPDGGRTVNDFLLTITFTGGGTTPGVCLSRWLPAGTGFDYIDATLPANAVFGAVNTASIPVPYGAFGKTNYDVNTFAEIAVDVTELMAGFDRCLSVGVKTIMVKTKTSQSPSANIVDFIAPMTIDLPLGPSADAGPDQAKCTEGASTTFTMAGKAYAGLDPIVSTNWTVVSGTATIDSTNSLNTAVHLSSGSATLRLTLKTAVETGCSKSDDVVLTVNQPPSCSVTGPDSVCPASTNSYSGPAGMAAYLWSISGNGSIDGSASSPTVKVIAGSGCNQSFTLNLSVTDGNGCSGSCHQDFLVKDTTGPTITSTPAGGDLGCNPVSIPTDAAIAAAATATDTCSAVSISATHFDSGAGCARTRTFTITAADACGNQAVSTVVFTWTADTTAPSFTSLPVGADLGCHPGTLPDDATIRAGVTASDTCSAVTISVGHSDATDGCGRTRTFTITATDACGNHADRTVVYTWTVDTTGPTFTSLPTGSDLGCNPSALPSDESVKASVTASDTCSAATISVSHTDSNTGCLRTRTFAITATDACGNHTDQTVAYTWTADTTAPTFTNLPTGSNLGCNPSSLPSDSSVKASVTASDTCSAASISVSHTDSNNGCVLTRTFTITATDACGNHADTTVAYSWTADTTAPTFTNLPTGSDLGCNPATTPDDDSVKNAVSASDTCSTATIGVSHTDSENGCLRTRTFNVTATDACGNHTDTTIVYTWTSSTTAPTFSSLPTGTNLGCNPETPPTDTSVKASVQASETCSTATIGVTHTDSDSGCVHTRTFDITATDACGNHAETSVAYSWTVDTTKPIISAPAGSDLGCNPANPPTDELVAAATTVSDGCSTPSKSVRHSDSDAGCLHTRTFTITSTDACNNTETATVAYTWTIDTTKPTISAPAGGDLGCNPANPPTDESVASETTVSDGCGTPSKSVSHSDSDNGCTRTRTFTITSTDACNNTQTATVIYTWTTDTTKPTISAPTGGDLGCNPANPPSDESVAAATTVSDGCSTPSKSVSHSDLDNACTRTRTFTITSTDACSNTETATVVYTWTIDMTKPTITPPAGGDLGCNPTNPPTDESVAAETTVSDGCSTPSKSVSHADSDAGCIHTRTFTITSTDACNNTQTGTVIYTWTTDTTKPTISAPAGGNLGCNPANPPTDASVAAATTVSDGCSTPSKSVSHTDADAGCLHTRTFTVTSTDACNNTQTATVTYTWTIDTTKPAITPPAGGDLGCNPTNPPTDESVAAETTVSDGCSTPSKSVSHIDADNACIHTRTFTITSTDACNNTETATVVYTWTVDTTPPAFTSTPAGGNLGTNPATTPDDASVTAAVTASDSCSTPTLSVSHTDSDSGCVRTRTFAIRASDACGNHADTTVVYTWTSNTLAPTFLSVPEGGDLGCNPAATPSDASIQENVVASSGATVTVSHRDSTSGCVLTRTFTLTATTACGNPANTTVIYTWTVDTTAPTFTQLPTGSSLGCNPATLPEDAAVKAGVTASDTCSAATISVSHTDSNNGCGRTRTFAITATDACGNHADTTIAYTWTVDTAAPTFTGLPSGGDLGCNPSTLPTDAAVKASATASDTCSAATISVSHADSNNGCVVTRTFTVTATDACGNHADQTVVYTWKADRTAPVLSGLPASSASYECFADVLAAPTVTATDNCDGNVGVNYSQQQSNPGSSCNTITRTWTATDSCGNVASFTQTITVADTIPPEIVCPASIAVGSDAEVPAPASNYTQFVAQGGSASDNCGLTPSVTFVSDVPSGASPKTITRTYRATDACGNSKTCTQLITVSEPDTGGTLITDTMRCTLPNDQLRLIFTPDPQNAPCYKLTASNPGQFYFNLFYSGTPGEVETFNVTLPYPWITQGAKPVEVYDGVTFNTSGGQTCLTPGKKVFAGSQQVTLSNYSPAVQGTTYTLSIKVTIPSTGFVFVAIHLDYGLKGTAGYGQDTAGNATACGKTTVLVPNGQTYSFSVSGDANSVSMVSSYNTFKKNPGVGGLAQSQSTTFSVAGATAVLKDAKGTVLATGVTDPDGWYLLNYKASGKTTSYYVTLTPPKGAGSPQTKSVSLKSNGYVEVDYLTP